MITLKLVGKFYILKYIAIGFYSYRLTIKLTTKINAISLKILLSHQPLSYFYEH